jgi:hypothetical protein
VLLSTWVAHPYRQKRVATELIARVLDEIRHSRKKITIICPVVGDFIARNPELRADVVELTPQILRGLYAPRVRHELGEMVLVDGGHTDCDKLGRDYLAYVWRDARPRMALPRVQLAANEPSRAARRRALLAAGQPDRGAAQIVEGGHGVSLCRTTDREARGVS